MIKKETLNDVVICKETDSIVEVSRILRDTKTRHLVVVDNEQKPVGIISTVDINNRVVSEKKDTETTKAKDIMTKPISTVELTETYEVAYQRMVEKSTYSIPVVENGKLIGELDFNQLFCKRPEAK